METSSVFKLATVLHLVISGIPPAVQFILDDYEEELKYILADPKVKCRFGKRHDFFIQMALPVFEDIIAFCL
eukprot:CAMPEP_0196577948 /NCGR_PEP_ID=MMETSP1081-20130531/6944_1 /TAXON_ID=36882 /ORGANISM="Pyramimonas amylifera, Strain CCMP720" /LENGTH=71 /DNA_ID=CAMNT_0041897019 /DNA_START=110 /DNA_END=322 /DNA_ORIENTATION=+